MRWRSQNLNEKPGDRVGSKLVHGRGWLRRDDSRGTIGVEWVFTARPRTFGWRVSRGGQDSEHDASLALHFGWFSLYVYTELLLPRKWRGKDDDAREYGLTYFVEGDHLSWTWHAKEFESSSHDPWWMHKGWFLADVIFGGANYSTTVIREEQTVIPMPERSYPATVKIELARWKRPRWPFAKELLRGDVDIPGGVPVPGKGENSWDCDQDAIYGQTALAKSIDEAVANVVESALKSRRRYGGKNWQPQETEQ